MYFPIIGLEIHLELKTKHKMFCYCKNDPLAKEPNLNICPICLGYPGTLPLINKEAILKVIKTGLALSCQINRESFFERKNYFYPDLPKGYQISQYHKPICFNGHLDFFCQGEKKRIRIERIHLEEDTGRLLHYQDFSLIDFNRAGVPLMELVTFPDFRSAKEARAFAQELQLILRYLDVSEADMEKGEMRIEVNLSLVEKEDTLGTKVEIKNLNSFWAVEEAIEYEISRQTEILKRGGKIFQETRGFDPEKKITFLQRKKEYSQDYRYFPEPDLPVFEISEDLIEKIRQEIPPLPFQERERLKENYQLQDWEIEFLLKNRKIKDFFDFNFQNLKSILKRENLNPEEIRIFSNYFFTEFLNILKEREEKEDQILSQPIFAKFLSLVLEKKPNSFLAKKVLRTTILENKDPFEVFKAFEKEKKSFSLSLNDVVLKIIQENPRAVEDFKKGKTGALQFLIGQVMKETKGVFDPQTIKEEIEKNLI